MKVINTLIEDWQKDWLDENSVTRTQSNKGQGLSMSEHIRKALSEYINKNDLDCDAIGHGQS